MPAAGYLLCWVATGCTKSSSLMFALFSVLNTLLISGTIREKLQTVAAKQVKYLNTRTMSKGRDMDDIKNIKSDSEVLDCLYIIAPCLCAEAAFGQLSPASDDTMQRILHLIVSPSLYPQPIASFSS